MTPYDIPMWIVLIWLFALGSVVGSFLNVCIYRIPNHDRLWDQLAGLTHPPSTCPYCKTRIKAINNIPIFGWLMLRGRCRACRHRIPPRYALIEFFNAMLWVLMYVAIVPAGFRGEVTDSCLWSPSGPLATSGLSHSQAVFQLNAMYLYYLVLAEALLVATFIDFDRQIIPDGATVPAMVVGVIGAFAIGNLHIWPVWFQSPGRLTLLMSITPQWMHAAMSGPARPAWLAAHPHLHGLLSSLVGIAVGGGVVWILRRIGQWAWKREVMGMGDVILMMTIGSFLGWQPTLMVFFAAPFCGLLATILSMRFFRTTEIAYGPYLSCAAMLVLMAWKIYFSHMEIYFELGPLVFVLGLMMVVLMAASMIVMRQVRLLFGFKDFNAEDETESWRSGDQLAFYANKVDDTNQRSDFRSPELGSKHMQSSQWPGIAASSGRLFNNHWKNGNR